PLKEELVSEKISSEASEKTIYDSFFHHKKWVINEDFDISSSNKDTVFVLIHGNAFGNENLSKGLRDKGKRVIDVFSSDSNFKKKNEDTYFVENNVDSYKELFANLSNIKISKIVHLGAYRNNEVLNPKDIYTELENGFFNVINLVKGLMKARLDQKIELVLIGCNAYGISGNENNLMPHNATVLSLGKVIEQEYQNLKCSAIDVDMISTEKNILEQLLADNSGMYLIGLREGKRYIEEFDEVEVKPVTDKRIVNGGTYIITGGTSGIGLQNAKLFSEQAKCNLILISRK
ncbi:Rossmann-fold NAD(P)-binding domain-containing protein, partial [Heyndrickxia sporothermodurans]|uniref:KR domain-containing protein n=1 Tax=Heyndrickxia sporothermodurans TaxID=46224 RepID=UPI000ABED6A5